MRSDGKPGLFQQFRPLDNPFKQALIAAFSSATMSSMYEEMDSFFNRSTWQSNHELDDTEFYRALNRIVDRDDFRAERMRENAMQKLGLTDKSSSVFLEALDRYVTAAETIHGFLKETGR